MKTDLFDKWINKRLSYSDRSLSVAQLFSTINNKHKSTS